MAIDTIKFKRGTKNKLDKLSYGEPAYISDEGELYIGTESGVEKLTSNKEVKELSSQLEHIENEKINKINTIVNLVDDYGAKANIDFDNSPILQNAINDLSAKFGGTIIIPNGLYIFKTPIFFDNTYGVKIVGTSDITDDQKGTVFKYVGQDWFFTMSSVRKSLFERIVFKGNLGENKGILINSIYSSDFKNCVISDFNIGIQIDDCAYLNIERTHFVDNANSNVLHQLYVSASKFLEFLYVTKCTFDGSYRIGDMVNIEGGLYVYFSNCDFCNFKGKLLIDIKQDNESIIFNECSFMGISDGVVVKNTKHHVNTVIFDKCILQIRGVNEPEKGFILINQSSSQGFNVVIDKLSVRKFSNTVYPLENILECTGNGKVRGKLDIINNVFPNAKVLFNNRESIFPVSGIVSKKGTFIVERQEDVKYYDINLFSNSPFVGQPNFVINCQDVYEYRYSSNNINGGDCNIRINFKDTPHKDFVFYYSIIE